MWALARDTSFLGLEILHCIHTICSQQTTRHLSIYRYQQSQNMSGPINIDISGSLGSGTMSQMTYEDAMTIPADLKQLLLPAPGLSIPLLIRKVFPPMMDPLVSSIIPAGECITDHTVSWSTGAIIEAPVPPSKWVSNLDIAIRNQWATRETITAIQHPSLSHLLLPLWAVQYWTSIAHAIKARARWISALTWTLDQPNTPQRAAVLDLIGKTSWQTTVSLPPHGGLVSTIDTIADLLSFDWLRETHMDTLATHFNIHGSSDWMVASVYLSIRLPRVAELTEMEIQKEETLNSIKSQMEHRKATHLVFPVNIKKVHWIVFHVNMNKKTFSYGERFLLPLSIHSKVTFDALQGTP